MSTITAVATFIIGLMIGLIIMDVVKTCEPCPETLPTAVTDMFTIKGDTLIVKQGVDFVISTRGADVDTAGIIHRKR